MNAVMVLSLPPKAASVEQAKGLPLLKEIKTLKKGEPTLMSVQLVLTVVKS
jgi:hypothetical protein